MDSFDWSKYARCRGMDTNLFFPLKTAAVDSQAAAACNDCLVHDHCLEYALRYEEAGFWAGTSARARARIRQERGIQLEASRPYQIWPKASHGTQNAYQRHRRAGEEACEACLRAHAEWVREHYPGRVH